MDRLLRIRDDLLATLHATPPEWVSAGAVAGRWLATDALARVPAPPHTCAAMDGYAVRAADVTGPARLRVTQTVYAGDVPAERVGAGEAARIFTGASLPDGADAVVREEAA